MKTQINQEENSSQKYSDNIQNSSQIIRQGARVGKTGTSSEPIQAKSKGVVQRSGGNPIPAKRPRDKTPIASGNTPVKRSEEEKRKRRRKQRGLKAVSEPKEVKRAIRYLYHSPTAKKIIKFLKRSK